MKTRKYRPIPSNGLKSKLPHLKSAKVGEAAITNKLPLLPPSAKKTK